MASSNNGYALGTSDRATGGKEQRSISSKTNPIRWTVGLVVRLCIWYVLLTPFFRCPSRLSDLTESSPRVCKPYLVARSYVEPHIVPYYNTYGAPYVDAARPYVRVLNEKVYTPASSLARQGYEKYGAPALDHAQVYGQQQWAAKVVPHIQSAKNKANIWYEAQVAPHLQKITTAISPYYQKVHATYWTVLNGHLLPFLARYRPFIGKTYTSGQDILTTSVLPYAQSTWSSTIYLVNNSLWPKLSNLYSENVEPQLVKIGQRLASYREGNRLRTVIDEVDNSSDHVSLSSYSSVEASKAGSFISSTTEAAPTPSLSPSELAAQARDKIASDLQTWQERFAATAERGVDDLEGRVDEIVASYLAGEIKEDGESLVTALETAVEDQTSTVKRCISTLAESLPFKDAPQEEQAAVDELLKEIRNSAISIRDRAHALREWRVSFDKDLAQIVSIAVNSTLAILGEVRDLGLQEIGMRWAWMDGVTYKDWEDYHTLKAQFEDWKEEFREIGLRHAKIEAAKTLADDVLSIGMDVAESAAKELARLKDVGKWKIAAREVSDDFNTRTEAPPPLPKPTVSPDEDTSTIENAETQTPPISPEGNTPTEALNNPDLEAGEDALGLDDDAVIPDVNQETHSSLDDEEPQAPTPEASEPKDESTTEINNETTEPGFELNKGAWGVAAAEVIPDHGVEDNKVTPYAVGDEGSEQVPSQSVDAKLDADSEQAVKTEELNSPSASSQPTQNEAIHNLLSKLLDSKDPSLAEDILNKLQAIYDAPRPEPPLPTLIDQIDDQSTSVVPIEKSEELGNPQADASSLASDTTQTTPSQVPDSSDFEEDESTQDDL